MVVNSGIISNAEYGVKNTQTEEYKEELQLAVVDSLNFNGTVNYSVLNNNLPEGFREDNGIYIKGKDKYTVNAYGNVNTLLPYGYKECEYLESTGTRSSGNQYINTEYIATVNTNIKIKYRLPEWYDHNALYTLLGTNNLSIRFKRFSGSLSTIFKKGNNEISNYKWGFSYEDIYDMSINGSEAKLINSQGTFTETIDIDFTDNTSLPLFLWALNTGSGASEKIRGRIYSFTIYENSDITGNYIPALDFNNKPCMFDAISRKTFYNQGTGEFIAGPEV